MVEVCQRGREVRKKKCVFFATLTNFVVFLQQNNEKGWLELAISDGEEALMLFNSVAISHAGNIVGHGTRLIHLTRLLQGTGLKFIWH
jgi:hypothetical protein